MAHDLQLDLDVLLPDAHGPRDQCVLQLVSSLESLAGVRSVHITGGDAATPSSICLHVDSGGVSLGRLADKARAAGAEISARYGHVVWRLATPTHASRAEAIGALVARRAGVLDASATADGLLRIEFDRNVTNDNDLRTALADLLSPSAAEPALTRSHDDHGHDSETAHEHGSDLAVAGLVSVLYAVARTLDWVLDTDPPATLLYIAVCAIAGALVARDVWLSLRARRFDIDLLMLAAAIGAAALGHWSDAALLLSLFSLGHALEGFAMARARRAIESLASLAPESAHRRSGEVTEDVPLSVLAVGDIIVVLPNERIPADGVVIAGTSSVDEAPITGESVPVDKEPTQGEPLVVEFSKVAAAHRVFAGTLNGAGSLDVVVARPAEASTIARVVRLVADAETQVAPTQQLTRRIVRVFVPAVLAFVALLFAVAPLRDSPRDGVLRALAVLVAASPCALAIATPSAVLAGIARAAREGVLVKGGGPLETLARVRTVAFDKTGTLTVGRPRLVASAPIAPASDDELLAVALAVERFSDHPLARAITEAAQARIPPVPSLSATDVQAVNGKGIVARVNGAPVTIGNAAMFDGRAVPAELQRLREEMETAGQTTMVVQHGDRYLGVIGVMDTARPEAAQAIAALRALGVRRMVMLSGDNQRVADAIARDLGLTEARGALLPDGKVAAIADLQRTGGGQIAMIGDGVNDAPALAGAGVGIAMGAAGSDVALETADIALMNDHLDSLPFVVSLARRASRVIHMNLFFSLGVVAVLIPLTLLGVGIGPAVIAHEGSTLVVVLNALALLAFRTKHRSATPAREQPTPKQDTETQSDV